MPSLITGGTGFLGAQVARVLLARGERRPVLFDRDPAAGRLDNVAGDVEVVQGDLGDAGQVKAVVQNNTPSVIYHLGGMLSIPSDADPAAAFSANAMGTFHVLEAARIHGARQVLFSSSISTYGGQTEDGAIDDHTLQRPRMFYGATKLFGEHMGLFYKRKYGLDFRSVRYPSVMGPGVTTPGVLQFTSGAIEASAKGRPYTVRASPETMCPIMHVKDAARAVVELGRAPLADIETVNYVLAGVTPVPTAGELMDVIRDKVSDAQIDFEPDPQLRVILSRPLRAIDDSNARREWGWKNEYDMERIVDEFLKELKRANT